MGEKMLRVLIISYLFSPSSNMGAQRYSSMCRYMSEYGVEPYVLAAHLNGDAEIPIDEAHIIRIGNKESELYMEMNLLQRVVGKIVGSLKLRSCPKESLYWYWLVKKRLSLLDDWKHFDMIIGTYMPIADLWVARKLARKYQVPWIADIRDLISDYSHTERADSLRWLDRRIEYKCISSSTALVVVTEGFKKILAERYHLPIHVIFNGWEPRKDVSCHEVAFPSEYIYYAGVMYEHRMQSIFLLLKALEGNEWDELKLVIRKGEDQPFFKQVEEYVNQSDQLKRKVIILPRCSLAEMSYECKKAKINLVLADLDDKNEDLLSSVPGKVYELLEKQKPILAIASKKNEMTRILMETGLGETVETVEEIKCFIQKARNGNYHGNKKNIEFYSRKKQAELLCEIMKKYAKTCDKKEIEKW